MGRNEIMKQKYHSGNIRVRPQGVLWPLRLSCPPLDQHIPTFVDVLYGRPFSGMAILARLQALQGEAGFHVGPSPQGPMKSQLYATYHKWRGGFSVLAIANSVTASLRCLGLLLVLLKSSRENTQRDKICQFSPNGRQKGSLHTTGWVFNQSTTKSKMLSLCMFRRCLLPEVSTE